MCKLQVQISMCNALDHTKNQLSFISLLLMGLEILEPNDIIEISCISHCKPCLCIQFLSHQIHLALSDLIYIILNLLLDLIFAFTYFTFEFGWCSNAFNFQTTYECDTLFWHECNLHKIEENLQAAHKFVY